LNSHCKSCIGVDVEDQTVVCFNVVILNWIGFRVRDGFH
jgi:hypothetical protein